MTQTHNNISMIVGGVSSPCFIQEQIEEIFPSQATVMSSEAPEEILPSQATVVSPQAPDEIMPSQATLASSPAEDPENDLVSIATSENEVEMEIPGAKRGQQAAETAAADEPNPKRRRHRTKTREAMAPPPPPPPPRRSRAGSSQVLWICLELL